MTDDTESLPTSGEQEHAANLKALYGALLDAEADPATPPDARAILLAAIDSVQEQMDDLEAVEFHKTTINLQAAETELHTSVSQLKGLQKQLTSDAAFAATLAKIADALDAAISSAESLGL